MDKEKQNEMMYQVAISFYQKLLDDGVISKSEFKNIRGILLEKYKPYISELSADLT
ncbi:SHOCT domain-containing protein [Ligilactobacillus ceti]|uniref:SHOCT-like domain-containing protein n=1 Tax=Ligilactobacillus ceti DSM 22408 TaxID=1122146 RepID=A0A0R2KH69_9LACO|nr:SHOCT domain-containing protein [Ligilactobacillus ceti]KRN88739.1 hypothetical protein IV53_GL000707 [Ligilactobacillus ceti DSM 22408]